MCKISKENFKLLLKHAKEEKSKGKKVPRRKILKGMCQVDFTVLSIHFKISLHSTSIPTRRPLQTSI